MADSLVLVWRRNLGEGKIHLTADCPTLRHTVIPIPEQSIRYPGPDKVGWLPLQEAKMLPETSLCERCN